MCRNFVGHLLVVEGDDVVAPVLEGADNRDLVAQLVVTGPAEERAGDRSGPAEDVKAVDFGIRLTDVEVTALTEMIRIGLTEGDAPDESAPRHDRAPR